MRLTCRLALTLCSVVFGVGFFAQPAFALTRAQADQAALKLLKPQKAKSPVVVFRMPKPLAAGTSLSQDGPNLITAKLKKKSWVYWMDLVPNARFQHPSVVLAVDAGSGRKVAKVGLAWAPLFSNKRAPFLASTSAYNASKYRVFSTAPATTARTTLRMGAFGPLAVPAAITGPPNLSKDCMIVLGDRVDPNFKGDFAVAHQVANSLKLKTYEANNGTDIDKILTDHPECLDAVIYISAHGYPKTGSNIPHPLGSGAIAESQYAQVQLHYKTKNAAGQDVEKTEKFDSQQLRAIIAKHTDRTYKLIVDACFSGRWTEIANDTHVRFVGTSSQSDQMSFGYWQNGGTYTTGRQANGVVTQGTRKKKNETVNPTQAGGFSNGIFKGLDVWSHSESERNETGDDLAKGLAKAFSHERDYDFAAQLGWTVPVVGDYSSRPEAQPPPPPPPPTEPTPPTPPPPTNLPKDFSTTWTHGNGISRICVYITGDANAQGDVTVNGTLSQAVQVYTTDNGGRATVMYTINSATTYDVFVRWPNGDGTFSTKSKQVTVAPPPTNGPAPPEGFAACPAPQ